MILSRRPNDDDRHDGFVKWPFMSSQMFAEDQIKGTWTLEIQLNGEKPQTGWIKEWVLMLHGTKDPPYVGLPVVDHYSKLGIVKKAHEDRKKA